VKIRIGTFLAERRKGRGGAGVEGARKRKFESH
jgi:hypothetical protein